MTPSKAPFASRVQLILVVLMFVSIIMLGQTVNIRIYQIGLILMSLTSLSQVAFGNILPQSNLSQSMRLYALYMAIIAAIFGISIWITPTLVGLGR